MEWVSPLFPGVAKRRRSGSLATRGADDPKKDDILKARSVRHRRLRHARRLAFTPPAPRPSPKEATVLLLHNIAKTGGSK